MKSSQNRDRDFDCSRARGGNDKNTYERLVDDGAAFMTSIDCSLLRIFMQSSLKLWDGI